jgi:GTP-binding protein
VGKSSYINRLLRSNRVIVSDRAGTTRDSVDIHFELGSGDGARHYVLIDTAGIRRRSKVKTAVERYGLYRARESIGRSDVSVLLLDAVQGPTTQDKKIAAEIQEQQKGCIVAVNKWDLSQDVTQREYAAAARHALPFLAHCPLIFLSARSGYNIRRSIEAMDYVSGQVRETLPTSMLNRALNEAQLRSTPPSVKGKRLRIYYSTQTGTQPVRIRMFVNSPDLMVESYRAYLVRSLRDFFGLEGAPVILQAVPRRSKTGPQ